MLAPEPLRTPEAPAVTPRPYAGLMPARAATMPASLHRFALQLFGRLPRPVRRVLVRLVAPSFSVGAICVIERADGRMLLVRQTYRSNWGLPGGLLKRHEAPADAVRREVAEEVGLDIELLGEPAVVVESRLHRVDIVFRARPAPGANPDGLQIGSAEIESCTWFAPEELPHLQPETASALIALARVGRAGIVASPAQRTRGDLRQQ
jgi:8-oxo-dGTP diphosphatase